MILQYNVSTSLTQLLVSHVFTLVNVEIFNITNITVFIWILDQMAIRPNGYYTKWVLNQMGIGPNEYQIKLVLDKMGIGPNEYWTKWVLDQMGIRPNGNKLIKILHTNKIHTFHVTCSYRSTSVLSILQIFT